MQIKIVAVGRIKEPGLVLAQEEYVKRLRRYTRLEIIEVDDEPVPSGDRQREAVKLREAERLQRRLPRLFRAPGCLRVALDSRGAQFTSEGFAAWLGAQQRVPGARYPGRGGGGEEIAFMLGGTLGLSPAILAQAHLRLSLSSLTFPRQLARVVLLEQLYRAFRILNKQPYHY